METNYTLGFFVGNYFDEARSFNVSRQTGTNILLNVCCETTKGLKTYHIWRKMLIWALFNFWGEIHHQYPNGRFCCRFFIWAVSDGSSKAAILISQAIKRKMSCNPVTWKWHLNRPINTFLLETIHYCQVFLDYMSTIDPAKLKCFDEAGLKMSDVSQILVKA